MTVLTDKDGEVKELTKDDIKRFRPAGDVDPDLVEEMKKRRGHRGPQKAPTKVPVTLRVDADVLAYFKEGGSGYQSRMNDALKEYINRE